MARIRDPFFDDDEITIPERREDPSSPPIAPLRRKGHAHVEDPTATPRSSSPPVQPNISSEAVSREDRISIPDSGRGNLDLRSNPTPATDTTTVPPQIQANSITAPESTLPADPTTVPWQTQTNTITAPERILLDDPIWVPPQPQTNIITTPERTFPEDPISVSPQIRVGTPSERIHREDPISVPPPAKKTIHVETQTEKLPVKNESIQTETIVQHTDSHSLQKYSSSERSSTTPLLKTLLDQTITSALPIISFCQPYSMTSHGYDIILAMPRHLMVITNNNSVSIYPWQQPNGSSSTILDCHWCSFLYKLLVTTLEENRLFVYDFASVIDSIKLRGYPLSIKHENTRAKQSIPSDILLSSSRQQTTPVLWSQTRFTKSNSLGIYYCYLSERSSSCMLTRIDHNTREHVKAIDCTGGSLDNRARVCALGLSEDRVAIVLTNLIMTLYDAETLAGLKQINLKSWHHLNLRGVGTLMYMWKTWVLLDPVANQIVGIGKRKRQFTKLLPEQPINACAMENGTLALWLGYPGAILYYHLKD